MSATFFTEAIVLQRYDWREFDQRISVYSLHHGLLQLVVRGAKRPKSKLVGHIEPMNQIRAMVVSGKRYNYLGSVAGINTFSRLKRNYSALEVSGRIIKLLKTILRAGEFDKRIYKLLQDFLEKNNRLNILVKESELLSIIFAWKLLVYLGYQPDINICSVCGCKLADKQKFFVKLSGNFCCQQCRSQQTSQKITKDTWQLLKNILDSDENIFVNYNFKKIDLVLLKMIINYSFKQNLRYCIYS